jgi:hypothetical protein
VNVNDGNARGFDLVGHGGIRAVRAADAPASRSAAEGKAGHADAADADKEQALGARKRVFYIGLKIHKVLLFVSIAYHGRFGFCD